MSRTRSSSFGLPELNGRATTLVCAEIAESDETPHAVCPAANAILASFFTPLGRLIHDRRIKTMPAYVILATAGFSEKTSGDTVLTIMLERGVMLLWLLMFLCLFPTAAMRGTVDCGVMAWLQIPLVVAAAGARAWF